MRSPAVAVAGPVFSMAMAGCRNRVSCLSVSFTVPPSESRPVAVTVFVTGLTSPLAWVATYEHV